LSFHDCHDLVMTQIHMLAVALRVFRQSTIDKLEAAITNFKYS
jgi:hypothetical protein